MTYTRVRKSKVGRMFSLHEFLPAHIRLCLFNILFVLFIFSIMLAVEILLDRKLLFLTEIKNAEFYIWFPPLIALSVAIFGFSLLATLYFVQARFWPNLKFCFKFGTCCIYIGLAFFFSTVVICPYYFVCFFLSFRMFHIWVAYVPTLFSYMCVLEILSLFNIGFVVWVTGWIACQAFCEQVGLKKKLRELMFPIKLVNDDQRIEISVKTSAEPSMNEDDEVSVTTQPQQPAEARDVHLGPEFE